jgi:hypothetical protein
MYAWKTFILVHCLLLTACGNYETGYVDGMHGNNENRWIVYGRSQYQLGYHQGNMEAFQNDWLIESSADIDAIDKQCPEIIVKVDPLSFLPADWKKTGPDQYQTY